MHFSKVHSKYGAPMGRSESKEHASDTNAKFRLTRVRLNSGGYDDGGAYWGGGFGVPTLWVCECETDNIADGGEYLYTVFFLRADSRDAAKEHVRKAYPNARFYR